MHLVSPLAAGVRGAENGTVTFLLRGTSTISNYYSDFEATQLLPGFEVALDSNGALVAYVAALVDVQVLDSQGVLVREFVAGAEDAAVEVISPSFSGVDYTSGASGTQKPTNLGVVLDAWLASAGAPDWKILFNGTATNLQLAFSPTFFNVKNYGALGNGTADDTTAITTAQAAAAVIGGILFFPPGTYRITGAIALAAKVTWLGSGGSASKVAIDSAVSSGAITLPGNGAGVVSGMSGMWIGAINGAAPGSLITATAASTGEFRFTDCTFGNDLVVINPCYVATATVAALKAVFTRCYMKVTSAVTSLILTSGVGRVVVRDCDLVQGNAVGATLAQCDDNAFFEGTRFDWTAAAAGGIQYLRIAPTIPGSIQVIGNSFAPNTAAASCTAIFNSLATPLFDCVEFGNAFSNAALATCRAYDYASNGYSSFTTAGASGHGSRYTRTEGVSSAAATEVVDPKTYGASSIQRTAGAALTVNATGSLGSVGDRWTLHIINVTGGLLTVTLGTNIIGDGVAFTVNNGGFGNAEFMFLPQAGGGLGSGRWYQVAPSDRT